MRWGWKDVGTIVLTMIVLGVLPWLMAGLISGRLLGLG